MNTPTRKVPRRLLLDRLRSRLAKDGHRLRKVSGRPNDDLFDILVKKNEVWTILESDIRLPDLVKRLEVLRSWEFVEGMEPPTPESRGRKKSARPNIASSREANAVHDIIASLDVSRVQIGERKWTEQSITAFRDAISRLYEATGGER